MENLQALYEAVLHSNMDKAVTVTREALQEGMSPKALIDDYMTPAMEEVGRRFERQEAFVPELLMAGRAMKGALEVLKPAMQGQASSYLGRVVIGTVKGDLHDIGKNLVASMLEGCGFEVINLGTDVSAERFVQTVRDNEVDILGMSALLTTTMSYMKEVIDALKSARLRDKVKVMVGGAPVTEQFARQIGADGYSENANTAVIMAKALLGHGG
ncbi:MAG TPA: corrinoid protein [Bacteroides togonis]|nr:corrinoid protein [Bacteroides togonis]